MKWYEFKMLVGTEDKAPSLTNSVDTLRLVVAQKAMLQLAFPDAEVLLIDSMSLEERDPET